MFDSYLKQLAALTGGSCTKACQIEKQDSINPCTKPCQTGKQDSINSCAEHHLHTLNCRCCCTVAVAALLSCVYLCRHDSLSHILSSTPAQLSQNTIHPTTCHSCWTHLLTSLPVPVFAKPTRPPDSFCLTCCELLRPS